jgi:ribosomal protein S18 acetylase RimI-like enzyme
MILQFKEKHINESIKLWNSIESIGLNSLDDSYEGILKFLRRNPTTCYIFEENNTVLGTILSGHDGRRATIYHLLVKESARGKGIGTKLVDAVISSMQKIEIAKMNLVVFKGNDLGNKFWDKLGFKERNDLIYRDIVIDDRYDYK